MIIEMLSYRDGVKSPKKIAIHGDYIAYMSKLNKEGNRNKAIVHLMSGKSHQVVHSLDEDLYAVSERSQDLFAHLTKIENNIGTLVLINTRYIESLQDPFDKSPRVKTWITLMNGQQIGVSESIATIKKQITE